ncbi:MAG: arylsulfatase, partial [Trueperaceae bacterium]
MDRPNIVLILADDTGWGDCGCYNSESQIPTPHIDRLAAEGRVFTDAHAPSALCTPTRYGLLTGRYYWRTAKKHALVMPYEPPVIEPERPTLASMLRQSGYQTACIGKWHLGFRYPAKRHIATRYTQREGDVDFEKSLEGGPLESGFDSFFGTAGCSTSDPPYCFIENDRVVDLPSVPSTEDLHALPGFYPGLMAPGWDLAEVDVALAQQAVAVIERHASQRPSDPLFLYYPLSAPHNPWVVPDFLRGSSGDGPRGDMNVLVDWCVGQVYAALERCGMLDDTLFIFTSDNGPQYHTGEGGHRATGGFRGRKNTAFEGGHRVPFVVRWPGKVPAGTTSDALLCLTDMMATFSSLTGTDLPEEAGEDSFDVLPLLLGRSGYDPERPAMVCDTGSRGAVAGDFAVRVENWKLIVTAPREKRDSEERLLFDLASDPFEECDLKNDFPAVAADLQQ